MLDISIAVAFVAMILTPCVVAMNTTAEEE